jgi:peptidoglycan/xylan/chitin deacetylase (PgdA/CDA1 family)
MRRYQDYQKHNQQHGGSRTGLWRALLWAGIIGLVILLGRGLLFGSGSNLPAMSNENTSTTNDSVTVEANVNANGNTNTNANTNTAAETTATSATALSAEDCTKPISQYGTAKKIALTFNGGAMTSGANHALLILNEENVPATFFLTAEWAKNNPDIVKTVAEKGYRIYNHSTSHAHFAALSTTEIETELAGAETAIQDLTGKTTKPYFRPPYGEYTDASTAAVREAGYCSILWTVDALDWQSTQTPEGAKQRILDKARAGGIVLMHFGNDLVPQFLRETIRELKTQGYALVSLEELLTS